MLAKVFVPIQSTVDWHEILALILSVTKCLGMPQQLKGTMSQRLASDTLHTLSACHGFRADVAKSLGAPVEPDSCALAALAARRALHLVAACLHVPAVHAHMLEETGLLQPPTTSQIVMVSDAACHGNAELHVLQFSHQERIVLA